jgi:ABC-2 type transport system permease protein
MKWYYVFIKSLKEQIRDYWILLIVVLLAPFFIFVYYLMIESENPHYDIVIINKDNGISMPTFNMNLGDSLIAFLKQEALSYEDLILRFYVGDQREDAISKLRDEKIDVLLIVPENFTASLVNYSQESDEPATFELVGNITDMHYIIGAVWTEELFNQFLANSTGYEIPVRWVETQLGHSGERTNFELYVPGMLILAIIMMMFSASAAIVREPEIQTIKRLKLSNLSALEFLTGVSILQIIIAAFSVMLALLTAMGLGYRIIPGTLWYLVLISFLTSLSIIAFSLIFAAVCRSIKDVAIIGTFPMLLFMFFSGAAFPVGGSTLFSIGDFEFKINGVLSATHSVNALNKVLVMDQSPVKTLPDVSTLVILTILYFIIGVWAFNRRHMKLA